MQSGHILYCVHCCATSAFDRPRKDIWLESKKETNFLPSLIMLARPPERSSSPLPHTCTTNVSRRATRVCFFALVFYCDGNFFRRLIVNTHTHAEKTRDLVMFSVYVILYIMYFYNDFFKHPCFIVF